MWILMVLLSFLIASPAFGASIELKDYITGRAELSTPAVDDLLLIYDTSTGIVKKITINNILNPGSLYEPIITAGTTLQYWRGDKTWQTLSETGANVYVHNQGIPATTWVITHNLGLKEVMVQIYNASYQYILPDSITLNSTSQCTITFTTGITGYAVVSGGGYTGATADHDTLNHLSYATAGHTGFAPIDNPAFTTKITTPDAIIAGPWIDSRYYPTIEAANTAAFNAGKLLVVTQNYTLTANTALTAAVKVIKGGMFTQATLPAGPFTLTINGPPEIGRYQVFSGFATGEVTFGAGAIEYALGEWWGAKADNLTASGTLNSTAINCALTARTHVKGLQGTYYVSTSLVIPGWTWLQGSGKLSTIYRANGAITVIKSAAVDTPNHEVGVRISDLWVDGNDVATKGIEVGNASVSYLSSRVRLHDLSVTGCANGIFANSFVYSSMNDILMIGTNTASSYGLKFGYWTQECVLQNVVVAGFAYNWYVTGTGVHSVNCVSYAETTHTNTINLLWLENAYSNKFDKFTIENLTSLNLDEVLLSDLSAGTYRTSDNHFINCSWIGTGAGYNKRITLGISGGGYSPVCQTVIEGCRFLRTANSVDINLANAYYVNLIRNKRLISYSGQTPYNPTILGTMVGRNVKIIPPLEKHQVAPGYDTWEKGMIIWIDEPYSGASPGYVVTTVGTHTGATDNTGDTDGSTAIITGMTDTSDFYIGEYVSVSAGFPGVGPYKILAKTASTITLDTDSNSSQSNITVADLHAVFKGMGVLAP